MTGWRLGFGVFPAELMPHVERLISNSVSCTASFAQQAAIAALDGPQEAVARMVDEFTVRRAAIVAGLNALPGVRCLEPDGAFYAFPNITGTGFASHDLADRLLQEAGVACLSGTAFGSYGEGFLRFSYANSLENIREALDRMRSLLAESSASRSASVTVNRLGRRRREHILAALQEALKRLCRFHRLAGKIACARRRLPQRCARTRPAVSRAGQRPRGSQTR